MISANLTTKTPRNKLLALFLLSVLLVLLVMSFPMMVHGSRMMIVPSSVLHTENASTISLLDSEPNLVIDKTSSAGGTVYPGRPVTYTIVVSNTGDADATGIVISDTLPANTEFVAGSITLVPADIGSMGTEPPFLVSGASLSIGESLTTTFQVTVTSPLISGTVIANTAAVTSTKVTTPQMATAIDTVGQIAGIEIAPDNAKSVLPGTVVSYTHLVTNTGNGIDTVELTFTSSQKWAQVDPLSVSLDAGVSASIIVTITVPAEAVSGTVDTTVVTTTSTFDPLVKDSATDTTTVVRFNTYLPLAMTNYCFPDPYEPNDSPSEAYFIESGGTYWAYFCPEDPDDFYRISVATTNQLSIDLGHVPPNSDYDLYLYNASLQMVAASNKSGIGINERIIYEPLETGTYYIRVYPFHKGPDILQPYSLTAIFD